MFGSSMFGSSAPGDSPRVSGTKGPIIEELSADDGGEEEGGETGAWEKEDKARRNNNDPLVEHPDDHDDEKKSKDVFCRTDNIMVEGTQPETRGVSFRKVTYGGINGSYYTATMSQRTGSNGVVLEESKQADRTTGQATHRVSRGIHDKGHSVTRKLNSDGNVDTLQTLHNLNEDEVAGFEHAWKGNAGRHLPGWNEGFDYSNSGASGSGQTRQATWVGWALPFTERTGRVRRMRPDVESRTYSSNGRPKKVITINIE